MSKILVFLENIFLAVCTEFVYGGHLLSLGASGTLLAVVLLFNLPVNIVALAIPYLISQVVYSYNHFKEIESDLNSNPERSHHLEKQKKWGGVLLFGYSVVLLGLLFLTNTNTFIIVFAIVLGGILYTDYFKKLSAKYFAGFKNFYIALFWSILVFVVPLFYNVPAALAFVYIYFFVFSRGMVNSAFFDIKDIESDKKDHLRTFAVLLGKNKTLYLLHIINFASLLIIIFGRYSQIIPNAALSLLFCVVYDFGYLIAAQFLQGKKLRNLSYIIVDAEWALLPVFVFVGKLLLSV